MYSQPRHASSLLPFGWHRMWGADSTHELIWHEALRAHPHILTDWHEYQTRDLQRYSVGAWPLCCPLQICTGGSVPDDRANDILYSRHYRDKEKKRARTLFHLWYFLAKHSRLNAPTCTLSTFSSLATAKGFRLLQTGSIFPQIARLHQQNPGSGLSQYTRLRSSEPFTPLPSLPCRGQPVLQAASRPSLSNAATKRSPLASRWSRACLVFKHKLPDTLSGNTCHQRRVCVN